MRNTFRAIVVTFLALFGVVVMGTSGTTPTMSASVHLLASYALKGTQVPVFNITSDPQIQALAVQYGGTHGVTGPVGVVDYPASWRPFSPGGFSSATWDQSVAAGVLALQTTGDNAPVIFGYSQGAVVGSEYKKLWNAQNASLPPTSPHPKFVFIGNGDRPNGGAMARFPGIYVPGLDMTTTGATPTETAGAAPGEITTVDIAGQYDPIADLPTNPGNLIASANAAMALFYVHLNYANLDPNSAVLQDEYGDTAYYLIPTYPVPLLLPVTMIPIVGPIAADMLDPLVRMMVEAGYDRTISPGQPTTANFGYLPNPATFVSNIPIALKTGLDNGLQDVGAGRPLQTDRPDIGPGSTGQGAYGIGGPPVTMNTTMMAAANVNSPAPQVNTPSQQPPPPPAVESTSTHKGPQLNVVRLPLFAVPGQTGAAGTDSSHPKPATPVKSALSGVTQSIKAVTTAIKDAVSSLKPKKAPASTPTDAPAS